MDRVWILAAYSMMAQALELERWVKVFADHGIALETKLASELRVVATSNRLLFSDVQGLSIEAPDVCICRTYERHLPAALERMGTTCLVSSHMVDICYDKNLVTQLVAGTGTPLIKSVVLPTFSSELAEDAKEGVCGIPYPVVLKPASGRGGHGVVLARNEGELLYHLDHLIGQPGLVQPLVDAGHDLRIYVIGGEVRYAMERIGATGDFRSNYSTGGTARNHELTTHEIQLAERVLTALDEPLAFGSVDFCYDGGQLRFCEVNANIGCRIPYEFGGIDLIGDYADWICETYL